MRIVIVGGGAAGMMAAAAASEECDNVLLLEKNEKLGKKLFITGKGRCNLTNACEPQAFFDSVITNPKFMYSPFYGFNNEAVIHFFEAKGLRLKTERGDRVFPASDHSSDVIKALETCLKDNKVKVVKNTRVKSLVLDGDRVCGVMTEKGEKYEADRVILALGGISYPGTGACRDAFKISDELGISYVKAEPSLVPMTSDDKWVQSLQGLSLKNVSISLKCGGKDVFSGFGEMLFTHFGVSGPLVLSASSYVKEAMYKKGLTLKVDLKPALDHKQLDGRILKDFEEARNKQFGNSLNRLLPSKLIPVIVKLSGIDERKQVNAVTKEERERLTHLLKDLRINITGNRGFDEAIITRGGISVKEMDPKTMESRRIKGLYFAGEMIDVDALTGGFNLQIAWSTGHLAGRSCTKA